MREDLKTIIITLALCVILLSIAVNIALINAASTNTTVYHLGDEFVNSHFRFYFAGVVTYNGRSVMTFIIEFNELGAFANGYVEVSNGCTLNFHGHIIQIMSFTTDSITVIGGN